MVQMWSQLAVDITLECPSSTRGKSLRSLWNLKCPDSAGLKGLIVYSNSDLPELKGLITYPDSELTELKGLIVYPDSDLPELKGLIVYPDSDLPELKGLIVYPDSDIPELKGLIVSCRYKFWTCCQRRTSDFDEFLRQEGCTTGDHKWIEVQDVLVALIVK